MPSQIGVGQYAITEQDARIIYVEPNGLKDITPKYEDFCISFNLLIEQFSRLKEGGMEHGMRSNDASRQFVISWSGELDKNTDYISTLSGQRSSWTKNSQTGEIKFANPEYNYLTTYYTEITPGSYKEATQIEGLGVENVEISYESWYTPTITIKFVDVRGAALFGREEMIHEDGSIKADNIFGAFFTLPYPKFRLQVKGFYGKPVTYQLACTNFKGAFNSQTGNFEATATFIGYSWSLLTDVDFAYLVAAPEMSYYGADYWQRQINNLDESHWGLWRDESTQDPPIKFKELIERINRQQSDKENVATEEEQTFLENADKREVCLNKIRNTLTDFINMATSRAEDNICDEDNVSNCRQLMLFTSGKDIFFDNAILLKYEEFYKALEEYSEFNDSDITITNTPNGWGGQCQSHLIPISLFDVKVNNESNNVEYVGLKNLSTLTFSDLKTRILNNGLILNDKISEKIAKFANSENERVRFRENAYLIDFGDLQGKINDKIKNVGEQKTKIIEVINDRLQAEIVNIVHFKPYIGNVFKLIFCHLETFCAIMYKLAEEINLEIGSNKRTPGALGIQIGNTDIKFSSISNVTAWPAIFDKGHITSESGYVNDNIENVYGWVGDSVYNHKFLEEKAVYAFQEAIQGIVSTDETTSKPAKNYEGFPLAPSDFLNERVFIKPNTITISELSAYLGLRAANIIGVVCGNNISVEMAKKIGKMDACNYYGAVGDAMTLKNKIKDYVGSKDFSQIVSDICLCNGSENDNQYKDVNINGSNYHSFETSKKIELSENGRHPIFKKNGDKNVFVHWYDHKQSSIVPTEMRRFPDYISSKDKNEGIFEEIHEADRIFFIPKNVKDDKSNIVLASSYAHDAESDNSEKFYRDTDSQNKLIASWENELYINRSMFSIITDETSVQGIFSKKQFLDNGNCKAYDYEMSDDLKDVSDTFLKVGKKYNSKYFNGYTKMLSGKADALGINKKNFWPETTKGPYPDEFSDNQWNAVHNDKIKNSVSINDNGEPLFNNAATSMDDLVIQQFKVCHITKENIINIFGCPFYYLQNSKRVGYTNAENIEVGLKAKALLFLHTFRYDYKHVKLNVFNKGKKNGCLESVPKAYLLLLGGLLWRAKVQRNTGYDPIVFSDTKDGYKYADINHTFFNWDDKGDKIWFRTFKETKVGNKKAENYDSGYNFPIKELFGGAIDYNIRNQLILLFENFVTNAFSVIAAKYELKDLSDSPTKKYTYTHDKFKNDCQIFAKYVQNKGKDITYKDRYRNKDQSYNPNGTGDFEKKNFKATSKNFFAWLRNHGFSGWEGTYALINVNNPNDKSGLMGFQMLMREDAEMQAVFKDLYYNSYIVLDNCHRWLGRKNKVTQPQQIVVNDNLFKAYTDGFLMGINDIIQKCTVTISAEQNIYVSEQTYQNRDVSVRIYLYLKSIWDKWLISQPEDTFTVREFFEKNFVFIDSAYKNLYKLMPINCGSIIEAYNGLSENGSLFSFISKLVTDHHCIFMPVPDFIGFNGDNKSDIETMSNLFTPMPYMEMPAPETSNKFVIMYTNPLCDTCRLNDKNDGYKNNDYDIVDVDHFLANEAPYNEVDVFSRPFTADAKAIFGIDKGANMEEMDMVKRFGYYVPSFGICFAKQNNAIFKNIYLNMDNPIQTQSSILSLWNVSKMGATSARTMIYQGQDLFNVYSNYSYSVEIEMMGNAQICPLMYFQLFNIPMWRGTYMVYKVTHSMTPGNMTTRFTGMKMNKYAAPIVSSFIDRYKWENRNKQNDECGDNGADGGSSGGSSGGDAYTGETVACSADTKYSDRNYGYLFSTSSSNPNLKKTVGQSFIQNTLQSKRWKMSVGEGVGIFVGKTEKEKRQMCHITPGMGPGEALRSVIQWETFNQTNGVGKLQMNKYIADDFRAICDEIIKYVPWFKFTVGNCYRSKNSVSNGVSRHCWGVAVDINPGSGGNPWFDYHIPQSQREFADGEKPCWRMKACPYKGGYDRTKCIWHWQHPVVQIFLAHGWQWGGRYGDVMHFSIDGH